MPLDGWDYVELWVGNAKQAAYFYEHALGFTRTAYAGPETGVRDRASYVLEQGSVRFVVTSALRDGSRHRAALQPPRRRRRRTSRSPCPTRPRRTARPFSAARAAPSSRGGVEDEHGASRLSAIATYGDTIHTFVDRARLQRARSSPATSRVPGDAPPTPASGSRPSTTSSATSSSGRMDEWVEFYERVFGMTEMIHFSDEDISTEYSALMSKVMTDGSGKIKFPLNEPAEGKRKSQIEEYLDFYGGPGAQHIAMATSDIVGTVEAMKARGVLFLDTPDAYYEDVGERVGEIDEDYADLRAHGILADRDDDGYLLQIFTKTAQDRPTLFFEVIERHGARGFGDGTSRRSSRRSSASRRAGGTSSALLPAPRRRPPQAAHPVPRERDPAHRGGDGPRGLHRQRVDPLPPPVAVPRDGARGRSSRSCARNGCPTRTRTGTSRRRRRAAGRRDHRPAHADVERRRRDLALLPERGRWTYFFRNGEGDEVIFVHEGSGTLETIFGDLPYRDGDYVVVPRGTTYRFRPEGPQRHLVFETPG